MPAPDFIGNSSWTRQPGATLGIEGDNMVVYSIPYAGKMADADNFRKQWAKGNACPVSGWSHLTLEKAPAITDGEGDKGAATLRFLGPDISGEFGEADPTITEYRTERQPVELYKDTEGSEQAWKAIYSYDKQYAIVTRIKTSKQATAGATPSSIEDPALVQREKVLKDDSFPGDAPAVKDIPNDGTIYKIKTNKSILRQIDQGTGIFEVEELHERLIVGADEV